MKLETLRTSFIGRIVARGDAGYAAARDALLFNARRPEREPDLIVRPRSVADVQAVIRFARAHGLRVSVRGGGHHMSGIALQEGILLDLGELDTVRIDPAARMAEVGPTVTNGAFARALAEHGLAFPVGHCATVPLSGYLLGGGFGWNSGAWGIACFSIESLDVVTADGTLRRVSATENADIFWAARGAGAAFFGVVTAYRLRLQPLPRAITTSTWTYDLADIDKVEGWMSAIQPSLPRNVEMTILMASPPPDLVSAPAKVVTVVATIFADGAEEARTVLGTIDTAAPRGAIATQSNLPTPFEVLYDIIAGILPEKHRYGADTFWSDAAPRRAFGELARCVRAAPSPRSLAMAVLVPKPPADAPVPDAAFSMTAPLFTAAYAIWQDPAEDAANLRWLRETGAAMAPMTIGHYLNEADLESAGRAAASFAPAAWQRLAALRRKYDPAGMFSKAAPFADAAQPVAKAG